MIGGFNFWINLFGKEDWKTLEMKAYLLLIKKNAFLNLNRIIEIKTISNAPE